MTDHVLSMAPWSTSMIGPPEGLVPALLTRMSQPPNLSMAAATVATASSSSSALATLAWIDEGSAPASASEASASSRFSARRPVMTTPRAPLRSSSRAVAAPIPLLAPVTMATLSSTLASIPTPRGPLSDRPALCRRISIGGCADRPARPGDIVIDTGVHATPPGSVTAPLDPAVQSVAVPIAGSPLASMRLPAHAPPAQ